MTTHALRRTPLFEAHLAGGARMVDFGGWEMPLHYGSQLKEHESVRRDAGLFDVSHMLAIDLDGAQAMTFLRAMLANDVARLTRDGRALYACMLRDDGGILDDLIAYRRRDGRYRLVVNAGTAQRDLEWLTDHAQGFAVRLQARRDLAIVALQGPRARDRLWSVREAWCGVASDLRSFQFVEIGEHFLACTGYTGEDGFEILLPAADARALWDDLLSVGVRPCGLGARDSLRLEAGMALYGQDMDVGVTPAEAGLAWTLSDADGSRDYIGRAALSKRSPRFHTHGLVLLDRGVLRAHQRVRAEGGEGETTSGGFAPTLERSIALARLPLASAPGDHVEVEIRDKWLRARVVNYPFVRRGVPLLPSLPSV